MKNFYVVQKWFTTELNLKGLEKEIFSIIYGFSQDGQSLFYGSLTYLTEITGYTRPSVIRTLKNLIKRGLIEKVTERQYQTNGYKVNSQILQVVKKFNYQDTEDSKISLPSSKISLPNNNSNNNNIIKENAQKNFTGSSNTDDKPKNNNTNPLNALSQKNKDVGLNNSLTRPACPTALHALEPEDEVPRSNARKVLFKNAGIDYDEAVKRFRQMPEKRKAKYRGLDIDYYLEVVDDWSVAKNVKRTPEGWWRTILQFMRSDMEKGRARYIKLPEKPKKSYNPYV